jgi:hypothetical protein
MKEFHSVNAHIELADDIEEYYQRAYAALVARMPGGRGPGFGPFLRFSMNPLEVLLDSKGIDPHQWNIMRLLSAHGNNEGSNNWYYVNRTGDSHRMSVQQWINRYDGKFPILVVSSCNPQKGLLKKYVVPQARHSLLVYPVGETPILRCNEQEERQTKGLRIALPLEERSSPRAAFEYASAYVKANKERSIRGAGIEPAS